MNRKVILLPLLSFFLLGCNGGEPFANDEYKPKGMTPTHKIVRALSAAELDLFESSIATSDVYLKAYSETLEMRSYEKKALPNHATSSTYDERQSSYFAHKIYENGVFKTDGTQKFERIYQGSTVSAEREATRYGVLNKDASEIALTDDSIDFGGEHLTEVSTLPYVAEDNYDDYFAIDLSPSVWNAVGVCNIGMTSSGFLAATITETETTSLGNLFVASDGSKYIVETNTFFEAYLAKGVDEESEEEYYYVTSSRTYVEDLIISYELQLVADNYVVTYRDKPILLYYEESVIGASTATNNNFAIDTIPVPVDDEEV